MKWKCCPFVCAMLSAFVLGSSDKASAETVILSLDPLQSSVTITVDALGGITATTSTTLSGTQDITLDLLNFEWMTFDGGNFGLSDTSLTLSLGPLGSVRAGFVGAALNGLNSSGQIPLDFVNIVGDTASYTFDPGDPNFGNVTFIEINSGLLTYNGTGSIGLLLGSGTLDFASSPASFDLPSLGQVGSLTITALPLTTELDYAIVMSMPISVSADVLTDPLPVAGTIVGQIVLTGIWVIPEPSTMLLLGLAVLGLVPMSRRLRARRFHG